MIVSKIEIIRDEIVSEYYFNIEQSDQVTTKCTALVTKSDLNSFTVSFTGLNCIERNFDGDHMGANLYAFKSINTVRNSYISKYHS